MSGGSDGPDEIHKSGFSTVGGGRGEGGGSVKQRHFKPLFLPFLAIFPEKWSKTARIAPNFAISVLGDNFFLQFCKM